MALVHSDGFDSYTAGLATQLALGDSNWLDSSGNTIAAGAGRFGGNSLRSLAATTGRVRFKATGTYPAFAFWFKTATVLPRLTALLTFGTTGSIGEFSLDTNNALIVRDGAATLRITTAPGVIVPGEWQWLELSFRNGTIQVHVNGLPVGLYTGAYTAPALTNIALMNVVTAGSAPIMDVDDFIQWNDEGSFFNTYALAPRRIQLAQTDANGTPVQWTPASGANWAAVKSNDWAGGVGVTANAAGLKDRYSFSDLAVNPGAIDAVVVKTRVQNTGGDPSTLAHVASTGAAEVSSTPQTVPITSGVLRSAFYRDANGAAWTGATVNAAEFGQTLGV